MIKPPNRFGYADVIYYALNIGSIDHDEPCSYEETMNSYDRDEWKKGNAARNGLLSQK